MPVPVHDVVTLEQVTVVDGAFEQTQNVFCLENGLSVATLATWLKRAREMPPMGGSGRGLLEVPVFGRAGGEVVIELGAGLSVRAPVGSPVVWLRELTGALRCGG